MTLNVMDIETYSDEEKLTPYCICLNLYDENYVFWYNQNKNIIIDFLEKIVEKTDEKRVVIYTHNINFDGLIILDSLKNLRLKFNFFVRDYNLYWLEIEYLNTNILIRCSFKILALSVYKMGVILNEKKFIFPHLFSSLENLNYIGDVPSVNYFENENERSKFIEENKEDLMPFFDFKKISIKYCIRDVVIVRKVLLIFLKIFEIYDKNIILNCYSFSSISYKIYTKKYDKYDINKNNNNLFIHAYIKNAYYGGRCEVFGNPEKNEIIHYFDFTGMYSQCMLEKFPWGLCTIEKNNLDYKKKGFHTIKYKCYDYLPFLPFRSKKLVFPNGEIIGTYWYEEIINAVNEKKCEVLEIYSSLLYEKDEYIFKEYVHDFIELRKKGGFYKFFGKNIVNGLYGSFAFNDDDVFCVVTLSEDEMLSYCKIVDVESWKKIGEYFIIKIKKNKKSDFILNKNKKWDLDVKKRNIAYAAIISSKARIKLNNSLQKVLKDGGKIYYTDTDSIFAGYKENRLNTRLGDIEWNEIYKDAVFISSKFYLIKHLQPKIKGVKVLNFSYEEIKRKFYSNEPIIVFKNQNYLNKNSFTILQKKNDKNLDLQVYDKREFSKCKKTTKPNIIFT